MSTLNSRKPDGNKDNSTTNSAPASIGTGHEQVNHGGSVGDNDGSNPGDNYDHRQDKSVEFHNSHTLDCAVDICSNTDDAGLRKLSLTASHEMSTDDLDCVSRSGASCTLSSQNLELKLDRHQQYIIDEEKGERQFPPIDLCKASDSNNNEFDGAIDSSRDYNYCNREEEEEEGDISGSSSDISDFHISSTKAATTSACDNDHNDIANNDSAAIHHNNIGRVRRRNIGNRTHVGQDRIDLIEPPIAVHTAVPKRLNWNEREQYKNKKAKIMKVDGSTLAPSKCRKPQTPASANSCRLSKDDFGSTSVSPPPSSTNRSSQSDIFKCNSNTDNRTPNDDPSINKYLSCVEKLFTISLFRKHNSSTPSKLKQSNEIKLHKLRDAISREAEGSSTSVTDEDKPSPDMAIITDNGYKTFKASERRHSRSKRNHSRESQHRLSQTSGYSKLDHHHYQTTANKHSFVHEYASSLYVLEFKTPITLLSVPI